MLDKKSWWEVVSPNNEVESKFFKELARNPEYTWRTLDSLSKKLNIDIKRVGSIAQKYIDKDMIKHKLNNNGVDCVAYWERIKE